MWHLRPLRDPPPFMAKTILNFHFDYLKPSLINTTNTKFRTSKIVQINHFIQKKTFHP